MKYVIGTVLTTAIYWGFFLYWVKELTGTYMPDIGLLFLLIVGYIWLLVTVLFGVSDDYDIYDVF